MEVFHEANRGRLSGVDKPNSRSRGRGGCGGLLVVGHRPDNSDDGHKSTGQFAHLIGGRETFCDEKTASGSQTMTDEGSEVGVHLFRLDQMSRTFLMMTLSAASDPRVTLRFAIMGSGTMLATRSPPAGPPTPMPRSRRESWRLGMGLESSEHGSAINKKRLPSILNCSNCIYSNSKPNRVSST